MNEPSCDHTELIEYAVSFASGRPLNPATVYYYRCAQCGELADPDKKNRTVLNRPMRETERIG